MIARLAAAALAVAVALAPPLHQAAEELMAAHMVQHLVLVSIAAPLLATAVLRPPRLTRLPRSARHALGRWIGRARRRVPHAPLAGLAGAWLVHVVVLWAWHAPALYEAALRQPVLHALEHASLLISAAAFWTVVLMPGDGRGREAAAALLALFAGAGQSTALGALLTLTAGASYPGHALSAARWGLTPLEDQHLAGLLMWVVGGLGYMAAALVVVARALRERGRQPHPAAFAMHRRHES